MVAPKPSNVQGSHPAFRVTQITKGYGLESYAVPGASTDPVTWGVTCASLAVYCPLPRPPAAVQVCRQSRLPILTPPSVLLPSCPRRAPLPAASLPRSKLPRKKRGRTGTESEQRQMGVGVGLGCVTGGFPGTAGSHKAELQDVSFHSSFSSDALGWGGRNPDAPLFPQQDAPESRGSSGERGVSGWPENSAAGEAGNAGQGGNRGQPAPAAARPSGHPDPERC